MAYDPAQPIKHLFSQNENAIDYVDAGHGPYTTSQVVTNVFSLSFHTGLFSESCHEWRRRLDAEKM
jgi:hypothetical protein